MSTNGGGGGARSHVQTTQQDAFYMLISQFHFSPCPRKGTVRYRANPPLIREPCVGRAEAPRPRLSLNDTHIVRAAKPCVPNVDNGPPAALAGMD